MFFTQEELEQLLENGRASRSSDGGVNHKPVATLFTPDANCTWLLTELSPDDNTIAFGLCDLGLGFPEIGYVSLKELDAVRGPVGLPIEKDLHFSANKMLSEYAQEALQSADRGVIGRLCNVTRDTLFSWSEILK